MNKNEFLERLKEDLSSLTDEERQDALKYYEEYFAEASGEREEEIITELVSPEGLADKIQEKLEETVRTEPGKNIIIIEDIKETKKPDGVPELILEVKTEEPEKDKTEQKEQKEQTENDTRWQYQKNIYNQNKSNDNTLKIILLVCTAPFWLPVAIALASVAFGLFMVVFGIIFAVAALAVAGFIMAGAGFMSVGYGIFNMFTDVVSGLYPIGAGFVVGGLGIIMAGLFTKLTAVMFKSQIKAAGWVIRGISGKFARKGA